jgi:hypothetical protein
VRTKRLDAVDRRGDVLEEDERVVVALVDRDPGEGPRVACGPLGQERRLPVAGGRRDEDERECACCPEPVDKRRPRDASRRPRGRLQLRLDDVEREGRLARPDEDRLRAYPPQGCVQGTAVDAETALSPYRFDVNFAIPSPASLVDEGCDALRVGVWPRSGPRSSGNSLIDP